MTNFFIDPEEGWKYGFPKVISKEEKEDDLFAWLIENGYPAELVTDNLRYRIWQISDD
jgi:hypothetical protein